MRDYLTRDDIGKVIRKDELVDYMSPAEVYEEQVFTVPASEYHWKYDSSSRDCDGGHGFSKDGWLKDFENPTIQDLIENGGSLERAARAVFAMYMNMPWNVYETYTYNVRPVMQPVWDYVWSYNHDDHTAKLVDLRERDVLVGYTFEQHETTEEGYASEAVTVSRDPWSLPSDNGTVFDEYAQRAGY